MYNITLEGRNMIYFLRHGEDDESYIGGWSDAELTENGRKQVMEICETLSKLPISRIVSSDIERAKMTSKIVSEALNLPVTYLKELREQDKGLLTGLKKEDAYFKYPQYQGVVEVDMKYPEGESLMDLYERVKTLLIEIEGWDEVLIVTHRGVINMVYFLMENRLPDKDKEQFQVTHASLHAWNPKQKKIERMK